LVRKGKTIPLSFYEVELVRLLHERAGEPVSREEILEKI
jgi:DNA-binding winged helix-turn-helix (wHTH) protein